MAVAAGQADVFAIVRAGGGTSHQRRPMNTFRRRRGRSRWPTVAVGKG
jgi:hypothetical protein